ncbi:MAG: ATP-dependent Clp protease proteolytic subunit [Actinobacteria bacterium]|nr:ATP-dependent Clp protease proteolytic subunit [Actinomycetota bacterium]
MPNRYVLLWLDRKREINRLTIAPIRREIEDVVDAEGEEVEIDIWLDSPGGDAHAAYKLALMVRSAASKVRVVIPDCAKSAATLLSVAGDEIYLAPGADMGPLDGQMPDEGSVSGTISALNIARAADEVARDAVKMAVVGGVDLLAITGLSRAQTIDAMLSFSAKFSEPLVSQLDPKVVHHAKQMLQVTAKYAEKLLQETGCHDPETIAQALVETFPTHGYVISFDEAQALGLPVRRIDEYDHPKVVRKLFRASESGAKVVELLPMDRVLPEKSPPAKAKTKPKRPRKRNTGGGSNGQASTSSGGRAAKSNGSAGSKVAS